ncbi:hypothetical protein [Nocardia camponoti]|uniref:Iron-containing redox enzyme family protein n=1 Tax=Nocardia camponoti TaxID=1616106 RepID=A0A917QQQ3_9NOCA|nr:hypothetical protein [Nocardia camponoti]GGK63284.1 hypothetical protein GCM10011591_39460 [Nocardia camponoti]
MLDNVDSWYGDPTEAAKRNIDSYTELRADVDALLDELIEKFYAQVPYADHQRSSNDLNLEYYKRHNIETILRLRRKRTIDALAIQYFTKRDPVRGAQWAHYVEDEMLHDGWFAADLEKVGVTKEQIYATEPMFTTKLLTGYLQYGMEFEGSPLALLCSVYFVEYVTTQTQPSWVENLGNVLGKEKVEGARRHVGTDLEDAHADFVWGVLTSLIENEQTRSKVIPHMRDVANLWVAYFLEIFSSVVKNDEGDSSPVDEFSGAKALGSQFA